MLRENFADWLDDDFKNLSRGLVKGQLISKTKLSSHNFSQKTNVGFLISKFTTSKLLQKRINLLAKRR